MTLNRKFDKWKVQNNQHGRQAFSRFVMLKFLDGLQDTSNDFVFKGGNLLWHYIKTPRETIDLDLSTINLNSHIEVKGLIEKSFEKHDEINFSIKEFKELGDVDELGAAIIISFLTATGQKNQFSIDIVYALPTDIVKVKSTLDGEVRFAASIENIVCDKLSASHQFKSGNTRMKDFDDLWRIVKSNISIDTKKFNNLLLERKITGQLELEWIEFLEESWKRHVKPYKDVPKKLSIVFKDINDWLNGL
ncbi:MAG: nucleotidyl transferase AbiEii/AbiGii toxin family protein [Bacteriovoracaceae bacterium]|jgi:hypothetical protein|nr:nucleotidyl transferase AbiEii/AbiGii toxin family protein [Bacteriovoracaceae bacterium]